MLGGDSYVMLLLPFFSRWLFFYRGRALYLLLNIGYTKVSKIYHIVHTFHDIEM